jgi:hypothetical protein
MSTSLGLARPSLETLASLGIRVAIGVSPKVQHGGVRVFDELGLEQFGDEDQIPDPSLTDDVQC